jgi:uncharacterized membrane protein YdjX (TVP38/TMEM64 family)
MKSKSVQRIIIVLGIAILIAIFIFFDLDRYFSLSYIKDSQASFQELYSNNRLLVIGIYMIIYVVVTALSLPGAAVMTLAGGALFGFVTGTIIVSFASSIGATLACFVARFLLRDWVQNKFGERLTPINRGIENEGPFYLFSLRLIPAFPFFLINLAMGLTKMRLITFYWVSQLGMLPGTMVYVNAGKELAKIDSLSGILSPSLIISFIILGIFPITVKKVMGLFRKEKTQQNTLEGADNSVDKAT